MKYQVIWHDCKDGRSGANFQVNAPTPWQAYFHAIDTIKSFSLYHQEHFHFIDLEGLVDEDGKILNPDIFLGEKKAINLALSDPQIWQKIFNEYKEIRFFTSPAFKSILDRPSGRINTVWSERDGQNTSFEDLEKVTYFYNFFTQGLAGLFSSKETKRKRLGLFTSGYENELEVLDNSCGTLLSRDRHDKTSIGERLDKIVTNGYKVSHIVCAEEVYGGDTHYSVWRRYNKAEIYEVGEDE